MTFNVWWIKFTDPKIKRLYSNTIHIKRLFIINICCEALINFVFFTLILFKLVLHVFPQNNLTAFLFVVLLNIFYCLRFSNASFSFLFRSQKAYRIWFWWKFIFIFGTFRIISIDGKVLSEFWWNFFFFFALLLLDTAFSLF